MSRSKYQTICKWKKRGLICDDYNALYETYIKTMECQHCNKAFKKSSDRCLDHNHETGLFRKIVCHRCNAMDSYIKYPNEYTRQEKIKEKFKEYIKEYYQANNEKIKEQIKEYRQANKQKIKEQKKEYYQANKEKILEQNKEKIECECGSIVRRPDILRHKRTKKHSDYKLNNLL